MGILSSLTDSLFGDDGKSAKRAQTQENIANREFIREGINSAKEDVNRLFPQSEAARLFGAQGAQNVMQGYVPQQMGAFQQGNMQAQTTQSMAPQQIQNALMGLPVDYGFLQPQPQYEANFDFLNQPIADPNASVGIPDNNVDAKNAQVDRIINDAYRDLFGREPDPAGRQTYTDFLKQGTDHVQTWAVDEMLNAMKQSPEYLNKTQQGFGNLVNRGNL